MKIEIPELQWSDWYRWDQREDIPNCRWPGIYRIAIGSESRLDKLDGWSRVRYIGMSLAPEDVEAPASRRCGLTARWRSLDRALRTGKGHSGGNRMFEEYGALDAYRFPGKKGLNHVFVSAMPYAPRKSASDVGLTDSPTQLREDGLVAYLEFEAFAQYMEARPKNRRPKFNSR